ncbi:MAG: hypothetical protein GY714_06990 [Desulfobacterales bacterium]|nr:hypothetical protein [Desulfobacterales bacterium]
MQEQKLRVVTKTEEVLKDIETGKSVSECLGSISYIDDASREVFVDFKENPFNKPVKAIFKRSVSESQVKTAMEKKLPVRIEFIDDNMSNPVIKDIYFSMFEKEKLQDIHIKGNSIVFEGEKELIFKCGDINVKCSSENGEFKVSAEKIKMNAKGDNEITGTIIKLN